MEAKFTYFDFLGYFVPGLILLWSLQQAARFLDLAEYFKIQNWAYESLVGVVFAFVIGEIISVRAAVHFEGKSEKKGARAVFNKGLISENYLLKGIKVYGISLCDEKRWEKLIEMAKKHHDLSAEDIERLINWNGRQAVAQAISQRVYRPLLTMITDENIGQKAITQNVLYVFFRGLNVTAAYSAMVFVIVILSQLASHAWKVTDPRILLPLFLVVLFSITSRVARTEAIHAAVHHVREVFDSARHFYEFHKPGS